MTRELWPALLLFVVVVSLVLAYMAAVGYMIVDAVRNYDPTTEPRRRPTPVCCCVVVRDHGRPPQ